MSDVEYLYRNTKEKTIQDFINACYVYEFYISKIDAN